MRRMQAIAAVLWIGYGVWMSALPIIVANAIVAMLALYSDWKTRRPVSEVILQRPDE